MATRYIIASPNEQQRLLKQRDKSINLERLAKTRQQQKDISSSQRVKFNTVNTQIWEFTIDRLYADWRLEQTRKIEGHQTVIDDILKTRFGKSHLSAVLSEQTTSKAIESLLSNLIIRQKTERELTIPANHSINIRNQSAIMKQKQNLNIELRAAIRKQENQRSGIVVRRKNHEIANSAPGITEFSMPTHAHTRKMYTRRGNEKENSAGFGLDYDDTCYHREYAVVKCESHKPNPLKLVEIDARQVSLNTTTAMNLKHERSVQNKTDADNRYQTAIGAILVENRKEGMLKEFNGFMAEDHQRKQENAGVYAKNFVTHHIKLAPDILAKTFADKFHLGDSGDPPLVRPKLNKHSAYNHINYLNTSEDSIQFDQTPAEVIVSMPRLP